MEVLHFKGYQEGTQNITIYTVPEGKVAKIKVPLENGVDGGYGLRENTRINNFLQLTTNSNAVPTGDLLNNMILYPGETIKILGDKTTGIDFIIKDIIMAQITGISNTIISSWNFDIIVEDL